jgi:hypothetical protein
LTDGSEPSWLGGRRRDGIDPSRIPPGQCYEHGFPVLSAGPTPRTPLEEWTFSTRSSSCEAAVVVLLVPAGYVNGRRDDTDPAITSLHPLRVTRRTIVVRASATW